MEFTNNEPKESAINLRCNRAEKEMITALQNAIRPHVSASRLLIYLCEEKANELGLITYNKDGTWSIEA